MIQLSTTHLVGDACLCEGRAAWVEQCVGVVDAAVAAGTDDEGSIHSQAALEHQVCGHAACMQTRANMECAPEVPQVGLHMNVNIPCTSTAERR